MFKFEYDYMRLTAIGMVCVTVLLMACIINNYFTVKRYVENGYQRTPAIGSEYALWHKAVK